MTHRNGFAHRRLDAYRVATELTVGVERLTAQLPRGHADLKDQVRRAASSTMRNVAEGANRWAPRDKASRYIIARGECGECDAALEMLARIGLGDAREIDRLRALADRTAALLTGLIRSQEARLAKPSG